MSRKRPVHQKGIVYNYRLLGFERVGFIWHALDRMRQRRITRDHVYKTIESPDETGLPAAPGRQHVKKGFGSHVIHVVYELKTDFIRVITTYKNRVDSPKGVPPRILGTVEKKKRKPRPRKPRKRGKR